MHESSYKSPLQGAFLFALCEASAPHMWGIAVVPHRKFSPTLDWDLPALYLVP